MRVKTGRTWGENSPRRNGAEVMSLLGSEESQFQFRDGEVRFSISSEIITTPKRTAPIDRPRRSVVR